MLKCSFRRKAPQSCTVQYKQSFIKITALHNKKMMNFSALSVFFIVFFYTYTQCIAD